MPSLKKLIIFLSTLYFFFYTSPSLANITDYRFYAEQVHDAQRSPAFPIVNNPFTLSYFRDPYRANLTYYKLNKGEYIQLFFVGGTCQDGRVGFKHYDANGNFLETVQPTGYIYGLTPAGFLHDNDNIGTFISTQYVSNNGSFTYTPTTGPAPETCDTLEAYRQPLTNKDLAINFEQDMFPGIDISVRDANISSEKELFLVAPLLKASTEALAKQKQLLTDYEQQIKQLNKQLIVANQLQKLQADNIEFLENQLRQYMQLILSN